MSLENLGEQLEAYWSAFLEIPGHVVNSLIQTVSN